MLTLPSGKEVQSWINRHSHEIGGGFCLWSTLELSSWKGQSGESEGLLKDTAKSHMRKKKFPISCSWQNSFPNFKSCVNTKRGSWRAEIIIWVFEVKMSSPKLLSWDKRISVLNYLDNHLDFIAHICTVLYSGQNTAQNDSCSEGRTWWQSS